MATGQQLAILLRQIRTQIQNDAPKEVADKMVDETRDNFLNEQYGNDDNSQKWPGRHGSVNGQFQHVEKYLNYPKLRYKGNLFRSMKPLSGPGYSAVSFSSQYAQAHNEGKGIGLGGDTTRWPPYSKKFLILGSNPAKRQFAGVGKRTYRNTVKVFERYIRKLI